MALLLVAGLWQVGAGLYIHVKALAAQVLIARAWHSAGATGPAPPPWPWADTFPVARLRAPAHGIDLYVLEGDSGRSLAFGPGHMTGTAMPGMPGNAVISAHRDTHFRFLEQVAAGDRLQLTRPDGATVEYRVRSTAIVDQSAVGITADTRLSTLTLVTCYPFNALAARGPLRYVVVAERMG